MSNVGNAFLRQTFPLDEGEAFVEVSIHITAPDNAEVDESVLDDVLQDTADRAVDQSIAWKEITVTPVTSTTNPNAAVPDVAE